MTDETAVLTKKQKRFLKKQEKEARVEAGQKRQKRKMLIIWVLIFAFIAAAVGGITFLVSKKSSVMSGGGISQPALLVLADDDCTKGSAEPKATLIEYSDFQCPACVYFHPLLEKLSNYFGNDLKIVYRHFPLPQHQNAVLAAAAAEAAGKQEKFWEMAGKIFESQNEWSEIGNSQAKNIFREFGAELGLDIEQFEKDIASDAIKNSISDDYKNGVKLGINATPTFFLNGKKINNPRTYEEFKEIINKL